MQHLYFTTQRLISFRKKISVFPKFPSYPPRFLRTKLRWKKKILEVVLRYGFEKCFEICFSVVPYLSVWFGYKKKVFYFFFLTCSVWMSHTADEQHLYFTTQQSAPLLYYTTILPAAPGCHTRQTSRTARHPPLCRSAAISPPRTSS